MTPVQAATIPQFMGNKDVVVEVSRCHGKLNFRGSCADASIATIGCHWKRQNAVFFDPRGAEIAAARRAHQETPRRRHHRLSHSRTRRADTYRPPVSPRVSCPLGRIAAAVEERRKAPVHHGSRRRSPAARWRHDDPGPRSQLLPPPQPELAYIVARPTCRALVFTSRPLPSVLVRDARSRRSRQTVGSRVQARFTGHHLTLAQTETDGSIQCQCQRSCQ